MSPPTASGTIASTPPEQPDLEAIGTPRDRELAADLWLAERICEHTGVRAAMFLGAVHDAPQRRERLRQAILANGLSTVGLGKHRGKFETYAAHFARRFGEAL